MAVEGEKRCPACAESIKEAAVVCRYCGYDFNAGMPGTQQRATKTNGLAIASMVLGIVWIYWVGSVLALVFGYTARRQIDESDGREGGRGMAIAGIVLGWVGVGFLVLTLIFVVIGLTASQTSIELLPGRG